MKGVDDNFNGHDCQVLCFVKYVLVVRVLFVAFSVGLGLMKDEGRMMNERSAKLSRPP